MMGRIMAIDYGSKRVGIAMSDPLRIFAKPHSVVPNRGFDSLLSRIKALCRDHDVNLVVIGMPYAIDGSYTPKTTETAAFLKSMQEQLDIEVIECDERYSSAEAETELKRMGKSWQEARQMVDAMAAAMILKNYLERSNEDQ
ncbi:MAG: putative pre6S rRNA nuclease [Candidatus Cloacimonadota bacterium]|nr:putative pre6S rRNA nuclease [Candidatus Cloacimonadota bacterium]